MNEFEFIESVRSKYSLYKVGDDCAVLPKDAENDLLVTADMLVEDIDFRLDWTTPESLGHKALAVSLSDIAAMGGTPKWAMLSLAIRETLWNSDFLNSFYAGWHELAIEYDVDLVGGDISRTPDKFVIDSFVGGDVPKGKAIMRSGAKPGDAIYVTDALGGAAGGLKLLEDADKISDAAAKLIDKQLRPTPQLTKAKLLQGLNILTSMIDLSDGLSSDLAHICHQSRVGAKIYADSLPIDRDLLTFFPPETCLDMALNGGEDFELLFTVSAGSGDVPGTCIGEITADTEIIHIHRNGRSEVLTPKGYKHF
jgi:thiamine-monophosphate kinase